MFAWVAAMISLTSCYETWDNNPRLETHEGVITDNFLNTPVLQNQYIELSKENATSTLHLTCSQPDMGYAALTTYKVQLSLTDDFERYEEISQAFYDCENINPVNKDMASSIEKLFDVVTEDDIPEGYNRIYVRLRAYLEQSPSNTQYLSNVTYFDHISIAPGYIAIWNPGEPVNIYLRGGMNDWGASADWQFVTGPEEDTWVTQEVTIPAGTEFKVADSEWKSLNLGGGTTVPIGKVTELELGSNPANLNVAEEFTGIVYLQLKDGVYYLTLQEPKE